MSYWIVKKQRIKVRKSDRIRKEKITNKNKRCAGLGEIKLDMVLGKEEKNVQLVLVSSLSTS